VHTTLKLGAEPQTKSGKVYWKVVKFESKVQNMEHFKVQFDNLFNGDKALSKYKKSKQPNIV
jgi:hypothetical protein